MKRNEILNDNIPTIIDKEIIEKNDMKYIIIHTLNYNEINNIINDIYLQNKGITLDTRNLYEEVNTKEYGFKKEAYIQSDIVLNQNKVDNLSYYWEQILGDKFKIRMSNMNNNSLLYLITIPLNNIKGIHNEIITIDTLKSVILKYMKEKIQKNGYMNIVNRYKKEDSKLFKYIESIDSLYDKIGKNTYTGTEIDLEYISDIFHVNIIIMNKRKRMKKDEKGYHIIKPYNQSKKYILLYKSVIGDHFTYHLIQNKEKIVFEMNDFPQKFKNLIHKEENNK